MPIRIPILAYHALTDSPSPIGISPAAFAGQMDWLHRTDCAVITLSALVRCLQTGSKLPERCVVITFDDGFESVYSHALPILRRYGFSATVFIVTGYCGSHNDWPGQPRSIPSLPLLTWQQISEMDSLGFEFGAHTISHPRLDLLSPQEIELEVVNSRMAIEDHLGHAIDMFAYPYGQIDSNIRAIVSRAYAGACTARLGFVEPSSDPFALARIESYYISHPLVFSTLFSRVLPPYLFLRDVARGAASTILRRAWR